jgi:1,3,6,8-tetrahydroxynaphthalene synthase
MAQTLDIARRLYPDNEHLPLILRLIKNTGVNKRHLVQSIEKTLHHPGFEERNLIYVREAKARLPEVIKQALKNAHVSAEQIDVIIFVSCTGFTMPSLTAWIINNLGFRNDTRQLPIAQLGCAAGGAAINQAHIFCQAYPESNVLIVACEFCSLCYQPSDLSIGNLLSNGLFGDALGAAVVRGQGGYGMCLEHSGSRLVMGTEDWISYAVKNTGFHFQLDRRVPKTMEQLAPELRAMASVHDWDAEKLDFYIIHAGGPRILSDLSHFLNVNLHLFDHSQATLTQYGNIASVVVLDALRRQFVAGLPDGAHGIIAGFGPGITAEIVLGTWQGNCVSP